MLCDICNKRPALVTGYQFGPKSGNANKKRWIKRKGHTSCRECWSRLKDRENASKLANSYDDENRAKEKA